MSHYRCCNFAEKTNACHPAGRRGCGIDKLVGKRGRSAFLAEIAREEIQRRQQRNAIRKASGAWRDEDHPELKRGSTAWIRGMRAESETRSERIRRHRDRD